MNIPLAPSSHWQVVDACLARYPGNAQDATARAAVLTEVLAAAAAQHTDFRTDDMGQDGSLQQQQQAIAGSVLGREPTGKKPKTTGGSSKPKPPAISAAKVCTVHCVLVLHGQVKMVWPFCPLALKAKPSLHSLRSSPLPYPCSPIHHQ
jgi:hypothetical protein